MLMSLPELFPNPGPITSTPKKPSIPTPVAATITNGELLNGLQNGILSNFADPREKWQVRSCPASPVGAPKLGSALECNSVNHVQAKDDDHSKDAVPIDQTDSTSTVASNTSTTSAPTTNSTATQSDTITCPASIATKAASSTTTTQSTQPCKFRNAPASSSIPGYRTVQNRLENDPKSIKHRLLSALTDMIPHQETLSLRLLVNYTIDDGDSQCLVIDETLCRQNRTATDLKSAGKRGPDSVLLDSSDSGLVADVSQREPKRSKYDRHQSVGDVHVLDLSLHTEREDQELNEAMNTELEDPSDEGGASETVEQAVLVDSLKCVMSEAQQRQSQSVLSGCRTLLIPTSSSSVAGSIPTVMNNHGSGLSLGHTNGPTILSTASTVPFLDTTVLTLLPLLQQQQQQQHQGLRFTAAQSKSAQNQMYSSEITCGFIPGSSNSSDTAEMLLLRELQALLSAQIGSSSSSSSSPSCTSAYPIPPASPITTSSSVMKQQTTNTTLDLGLNGITANSTAGLMNCSTAVHSIGPTQPLVGLPLFNPFGSDNLTAVQALLPTSNFTSFNLGSATLFNLKDHKSNNGSPNCTTDSASLISGSKPLGQPVVSLLNHITVPHTTPISLRTTLSTLSQLFNCSSAEGAPRSAVTADRNGAVADSKRLGLDALTASLTGSESKPTGLMGTVPATGSAFELLGKQILLKTLDLPSSDRISQQIDANGFHPHTAARPIITPNDMDANESTITNNPSIVVAVTSTSAPAPRPSSSSSSSTGAVVTTTKTAANPIGTTATATDITTAVTNNNSGQSPPNSNGTGGTSQFMFGRRLTHTRRFVCNQCRKNFASLAELNRHTLEAHNSFKCTICSAHFTQRSNLQRHSLKHVGFKPFTCNLCKKEYYRKDHLVRHIEVTHPNHDPKMNITVHLTSSECLDYLDRLHAGKQTPSPNGSTDFREVADDSEELGELDTMKIEPAATTIDTEMTEEGHGAEQLDDHTKPAEPEDENEEEATNRSG